LFFAFFFSFLLVLGFVSIPFFCSFFYLLMLLPWALFLGGRLGLPDDAATRWLMVGGILLSSLPVIVPPLGPGMGAAIISRTIASAWMFGGLMIFAALVRGALHAEQPSAAAKQAAAP
jgi:hypothetical protein